MGVNMAGFCIMDDEACRRASEQEIIRRYYQSLCSLRQGLSEINEIYKLEMLLNQIGAKPTDRAVVPAALARAEETGAPAVAMELPNGKLITGKTSSLLGASSACLLNALKCLGGIPEDVLLISPAIIEPIQHLKVEHMGNHNPRLHTDEVLIALSICAVTDPNAEKAMEQLAALAGGEVHSTVILSRVDENVFQHLGMNLTCEPKYQTKKLYHGKK